MGHPSKFDTASKNLVDIGKRLQDIAKEIRREGQRVGPIYMVPEAGVLRRAADKVEDLAFLIAAQVVPSPGLEPGRLAAGDFESPTSTNSVKRAL